MAPASSSLGILPYLVLLLFLAAPARAQAPTLLSSTSSTTTTRTFCSAAQSSSSSSPAVTSDAFATFFGAVCNGTDLSDDKSYSASWRVAPGSTGRVVYGIGQCRPDGPGPAPACAACLAAASRYMAQLAGCTASAVWHDDGCFLRYAADQDPSFFHDDEYNATVFNTTGTLPLPHGGGGGRAVATGLLAAVADSMVSGTRCSIGAGTAAASGIIYGLARCVAGIACADCGRCLRGAVAEMERAYNGSAGMQVLRLSCMARYESYPLYNATALRLLGVDPIEYNGGGGNGSNSTAVIPPAPAPRWSPAHPAAPPGQTEVIAQRSHARIRKRLTMLVASIVIGVFAAVIFLSIWFHRRGSSAVIGQVVDGMQGGNMYPQEDRYISLGEEAHDEEGMSCQLYSYEVLEAATGQFSNRNKLGSGGFGIVYKGTFENGKEIAVKRLKDSKRSIQELEREISIVANLRHKNLLRFLGYCFQEEGRLLVYEYAPNNSLEKLWHKGSTESQKLEWATWFNIIKGVARGLQFLHDQGIIHRDLKPHNVVLDENLNPKIADFDLMRVYNKEKTHESTEKVAGTLGYLAPECTSGRKFLLSVKSDVYSYGVLVLEIIIGHKINTFEGQNCEGLVEYVWQHWTERRAGDVVDGGLLGLDLEEGQERALRQALRCVHVALLCVQSDRARRPTMGQVIAMLSCGEGTEEELQLPEPSVPGYVHQKAAPGVIRSLACLRC